MNSRSGKGQNMGKAETHSNERNDAAAIIERLAPVVDAHRTRRVVGGGVWLRDERAPEQEK
jgi:hypothetical protein